MEEIPNVKTIAVIFSLVLAACRNPWVFKALSALSNVQSARGLITDVRRENYTTPSVEYSPPGEPALVVTPTPEPIREAPPKRSQPKPPVTRASASEAVKDYYSMVNSRQYDRTWELLSPEFRKKYSKNSFTSYKNWWNKVDWIEVKQTEPIRQGENQAVVEIDLTYHLKSGKELDDYNRFFLVFDSSTNNWLIDDRTKEGG